MKNAGEIEADIEFANAIKLRDAGKTDAARRILERLAAGPFATCAVFVVLGTLQWDQNLLPDAVQSFRRAVHIFPQSDLASLGLFHTLIESGFDDEAFDEMRRFLSIADSDEYRNLIKEING